MKSALTVKTGFVSQLWHSSSQLLEAASHNHWSHLLLVQPTSDESVECIIVVVEYESGGAGLLRSSKNQGQL